MAIALWLQMLLQEEPPFRPWNMNNNHLEEGNDKHSIGVHNELVKS